MCGLVTAKVSIFLLFLTGKQCLKLYILVPLIVLIFIWLFTYLSEDASDRTKMHTIYHITFPAMNNVHSAKNIVMLGEISGVDRA